jgi:hypothetical protein
MIPNEKSSSCEGSGIGASSGQKDLGTCEPMLWRLLFTGNWFGRQLRYSEPGREEAAY